MIVDFPMNFGLVVGQDRVIPEDNDARLYVPPSIVPVVLALQRTSIDITGNTNSESVVDSQVVTRAPSSGALDTTIVLLTKGLWEIEAELSYNSDFASVPATPSVVQLGLVYQGITTNLSNLFLHIGDATTYSRWRFLFTSAASLILRTPATGVGQNLTARAGLNGIRIL